MHRALALFLLLPILAASCSSRDRTVRSYSVPKAVALTDRPAATITSSTGTLAWSAPRNWKAKGASDMRLASFDVESPKGSGDASIVVLGGDAGGVAANVNRWRGQAGLAALAEDAVLRSGVESKGALGSFEFFNILPQSAGKEGILAAIFPQSTRSVFVKLTGSPSFLEGQKKAFLEFCRTLREEHGASE